MEAEYVATCEATKEAIWLKKFLSNLGVMRMEQLPITLFRDNNEAVAQSKDVVVVVKIATCEAAKEAIWLKKFLSNLGVMRME